MNNDILLKFNEYSVDQLITLQNKDLSKILQNFYGKIQKPSSTTLSGQHELIQDLILSVINSRNFIKYSEKYILEIAYKIYFKILQLSNKNDDKFYPNLKNMNSIHKSLILLAVLETNYCINCEYLNLKEIGLNLFHESILNRNSYMLLVNLKILNLLYKRYSSSSDINFQLEYLYYCLQSNKIGVRDESIHLIINLMKNYQNSCKYLKILLNFWPWTNRMKFFILSAILTNYKLSKFYKNSIITETDINYIMNGIKLSLSHKNLFSVGQFLIKTLDKQQEYEIINQLVCMIIKAGTFDEVKNLYTQWQRIITQKEEIFDKLNLNDSWERIQENSNCKFLFENEDDTDDKNRKNYKLPLICNIFIQQIIKHKDFNEICMYLEKICFQYPLESQLYTYIFILDIANVMYDFRNCLNFLLNFLKIHLDISNVEIRHTIINKIPQLFDLLSRKYSKSIQKIDEISNSNEHFIFEFFKGLMIIITQNGLLNKEYQTLIFSLKILEILNRTYFEVDQQKRITKNSNMKLNQMLGEKLIKKHIYIKEDLQKQLFEILNCLECRYDDVYDIIIIILQQMNLHSNFDIALNLCKISNSSSLIDYCSLSTYYARICLNSSQLSIEKNELLQEFYEYCIENIEKNQNKIKNDPLKTCKNGEHLFGYINSLNEFLIYNFHKVELENIYKIIDMIESINVMLLKMLNEASNLSNYAPSFQIMDESLEILINQSCIDIENSANDKKFLLLSFWMTLKACCDLGTTIGIELNSILKDEDYQKIEYLRKCVFLNVEVLSRCRHKGAIEAAGLSLGKLVKSITLYHSESSKIYQILFKCFSVLFENVNGISLTRRGAGLSIMFHHLLKNESNKDRPLFNYAIKKLLNYELKITEKNNDENDQNVSSIENEQYENFNALILHYLCVIVKDTELKENISEYFDEIMMAAIKKIENNDWRVRNAALQLFGALVPKIIGQKQILFENSWIPIEFTFSDAFIKLPKTCEYVIKYFYRNLNEKNFSTSSLISFLEFFSNVEYIRIDDFYNNDNDNETRNINLYSDKIEKFKSLFWSFLSYKYEKVRKLAARCIARIHDFHLELIHIIEKCIEILFKEKLDENFRHGILLCILECYYKMKYNIKLIRNFENFNLKDKIRMFFYKYYHYQYFSFYLRLELINFFKILEFNFDKQEILQILFSNQNITKNNIKEILNKNHLNNSSHPGYTIWKENISEIYKLSS